MRGFTNTEFRQGKFCCPSASGELYRLPTAKVYALTPLMKQDYYADLGVAKTAPEAEIKAAYRKLALKHHPDRQGDPILFQKVTEAYEVLGDPIKRKAYEADLNNARVVDLQAESTALVEEYFRQFKS